MLNSMSSSRQRPIEYWKLFEISVVKRCTELSWALETIWHGTNRNWSTGQYIVTSHTKQNWFDDAVDDDWHTIVYSTSNYIDCGWSEMTNKWKKEIEKKRNGQSVQCACIIKWLEFGWWGEWDAIIEYTVSMNMTCVKRPKSKRQCHELKMKLQLFVQADK